MMVSLKKFKSLVDDYIFSLDFAEDGEKEFYNYIGRNRSIGQLLNDMIIYSNNLATNNLIELVDTKKF